MESLDVLKVQEQERKENRRNQRFWSMAGYDREFIKEF
jgi:hypothetical protein